MATISGTVGKVTNVSANGDIAHVKSWSLDVAPAELDASSFGSTWRLTDSGVKEWSGSFEALYESGVASQSDLWDRFIAGESVSFYFVVSEESRYEGNIKITSITPSQSHDGLATLNVAFKGTGELVRGPQLP